MVKVTTAACAECCAPLPKRGALEKKGAYISRSWTTVTDNTEWTNKSKMALIGAVFIAALSVMILAECGTFGAASALVSLAAYGTSVISPIALSAILYPKELKVFFQQVFALFFSPSKT